MAYVAGASATASVSFFWETLPTAGFAEMCARRASRAATASASTYWIILIIAGHVETNAGLDGHAATINVSTCRPTRTTVAAVQSPVRKVGSISAAPATAATF